MPKALLVFILLSLSFTAIVLGYDEDKSFNLVFCPLGYQNHEDFLKDREILIQGLKKTKPFDKFNNFKFWDIILSKAEQSEIFKPTRSFPPLMVRQDFATGIANHIKSIYKLIIIDAKGSLSCAELSSIDKFSLVILGRNRYANKEDFLKGFLHELGHSLGLRDECISCEEVEPGPPNCAATREEAERLWGDLAEKDLRVNYFSGCCGNKGYIRPTIASFMNDTRKAADYGPVNEKYIRKELRRLKQ